MQAPREEKDLSADDGGSLELDGGSLYRYLDPLSTLDSAFGRTGEDVAGDPPGAGDVFGNQVGASSSRQFERSGSREPRDAGEGRSDLGEIRVRFEFVEEASHGASNDDVSGPSWGLPPWRPLELVAQKVWKWGSALYDLVFGEDINSRSSHQEDLACICQVLCQVKTLSSTAKEKRKHGPRYLNRDIVRRADRFMARMAKEMGQERSSEFVEMCCRFLEEHEEGVQWEVLPSTTELDEKLTGWPEIRQEFRKLILSVTSGTLSVTSGTTERESRCVAEDMNNTCDPFGDIKNFERIEQINADMARSGLRITSFGDAATWLALKKRPRHFPTFTYAYGGISLIVFAFMAGAYPAFSYGDDANQHGFNGNWEHSKAGTPGDMAGWMSLSQKQSFPFKFLLAWGGRYGPSILSGDWWRWFTSPFVHQNFQHVASNSLLLASLCGYIEYIHGTWRTMLVFFLTCLAGNFMSASFEDPCVLVVGASGAVFGFMGFFIADSVKNFESSSRPILRLTVIVGLALFFLFTVFGSQKGSYVSHYSHIGGLLCGLLSSCLIIPNIKQAKWKIAREIAERLGKECHTVATPNATRSKYQFKSNIWEQSVWSNYTVNPLAILGMAVLVIMFCVLPIYLYSYRLPSTECLGVELVDPA